MIDTSPIYVEIGWPGKMSKIAVSLLERLCPLLVCDVCPSLNLQWKMDFNFANFFTVLGKLACDHEPLTSLPLRGRQVWRVRHIDSHTVLLP